MDIKQRELDLAIPNEWLREGQERRVNEVAGKLEERSDDFLLVLHAWERDGNPMPLQTERALKRTVSKLEGYFKHSQYRSASSLVVLFDDILHRIEEREVLESQVPGVTTMPILRLQELQLRISELTEMPLRKAVFSFIISILSFIYGRLDLPMIILLSASVIHFLTGNIPKQFKEGTTLYERVQKRVQFLLWPFGLLAVINLAYLLAFRNVSWAFLIEDIGINAVVIYLAAGELVNSFRNIMTFKGGTKRLYQFVLDVKKAIDDLRKPPDVPL